MNDANNDDARKTAITVHVTTYRKGCPDNASGRGVGYGLTAKAAIAACRPWANQAPWLSDRTKRITITDHPSCESAAWAACGGDAADCDPTPIGRAIVADLRAGRYVDAVSKALVE